MASLNKQYKRLLDIILRLLVVFLIFLFTYRIIEPFISLLLWATVIAIALGPVHDKISSWLRNSPKIASFVIVLLLLAVVIMPFVSLTEALVHNTRLIKSTIDSNEIHVFTPNESVKGWPVIGEKVYEFWEDISTNTAGFFEKNSEHLATAVQYLVDIVTKSAKALLFFIASLFLAGFILVYSKERRALGKKIGVRLAGDQGAMFAGIAESTIKNVVTGVIGVAVIQSLLVGIGLFAGGVPYAGIWTLLCLVLAIVQIGPMPIVLPIVVWYFTAHNITPAVFFAIWMGVTMISDNILKPILYGRGSTVPMLVIFVGAVGGLLYSGIIGLFLGPVFLAFAYELFRHWLNQGEMKPIPELEGGAVDEQPSTEIPKS